MPKPRGAQLNAMMADYRAVTGQLDAMIKEVASLTVSARSSDRSVEATVGADGQLRQLIIDPSVAARLDARALAARVLEATQLAASAVRERLQAQIAGVLPERMRHLIGPDGTVDMRLAFPVGGGEPDLARS